MRTNSFIVLVSVIVIIALPFSAVKGFNEPSPLERAKELIKSDQPEEALEALSIYQPAREEIADYHYTYAQVLVQVNKQYDSIEHYRLAYLYAGSRVDKERILLERAEIYAALGYYHESIVCFDVFSKQYPKSVLSERAALGIAESSYRLGEFREALAQYEKAGTSLTVLYGKANALQSLGRTKEAYAIYHDLIENDPEIINAPPETLYNIGENFRQSGKLAEPKIYLSAVKDDIFRYRAAKSLGLIAMKEHQFEEALNYFNTAAESPERQLRREAAIHRADAYERMGKSDEAQVSLLEVKDKFPYTTQYDNAMLLLAKQYREKGNFNESVALLKKLIYLRTPSSAALDELEAIMLEIRERDRDVFVKLWKDSGRWLMDPSRTVALISIAKGLRFSGRPFIELCGWLIRNGDENARSEGRLLLADYYADLGDSLMAWGYLQRARIKVHNDDALRVKAKLYRTDKNFVKASETIMSIRTIREADMLALLDMLKDLKIPEKTVGFCKRTLMKTPTMTRSAVRFADFLYDTGKVKDALACYQAATATGPGTRESASPAEIEWAHYRISMLASGPARAQSLKAIQKSSNPVGRLANAEMKVNPLRKKIE